LERPHIKPVPQAQARRRRGAPTQSAVIVSVGAAEGLVGGFRADLDPAAALGVPAHVTVIAPFVAPHLIDGNLLAALAETVRPVGAFDVVFARVAWFADTVVWLAPEPSARFRELTKLVWARFPDYPPYGGIYDDVVPHLTIGENSSLTDMRAAAQVIERSLPITARVDRVALIQGSAAAGSWRTVAELPLAD
jgi:2'-5' RNA ligase